MFSNVLKKTRKKERLFIRALTFFHLLQDIIGCINCSSLYLLTLTSFSRTQDIKPVTG